MDEILRNLRAGTRVLDLGSLTGSFRGDSCPDAVVVRLDLQAPAPGTVDGFVQADAARLPFPDRSFDAIIANHSLEHIRQLPATLQEIGRVVRPEGSMYLAVPDASTFSDCLYRWIYRGGGHINPFRSADALAADITQATGLKLAGRRALYSSFEYLNHYYFCPRTPWRLWLVGNGNRRCIVVLSYLARLFDRIFHTRASAYGWALYFGNIGEVVRPAPWSNVCVGCGVGYEALWLLVNHLVRRHFLIFRYYLCPGCGAWNFFTPDTGAGRQGQEGSQDFRPWFRRPKWPKIPPGIRRMAPQALTWTRFAMGRSVRIIFSTQRVRAGGLYRVRIPDFPGQMIDIGFELASRGSRPRVTGVVERWCVLDLRGEASIPVPAEHPSGVVRITKVRSRSAGSRWYRSAEAIEVVAADEQRQKYT